MANTFIFHLINEIRSVQSQIAALPIGGAKHHRKICRQLIQLLADVPTTTSEEFFNKSELILKYQLANDLCPRKMIKACKKLIELDAS